MEDADLKNRKRTAEKDWNYLKKIVETVREPFLVLDQNFGVLAANESFYSMFKLNREETENKSVYEIGDGAWNIPPLKELLEKVLPKSKFFQGFELAHDFPIIGKKVMIINARNIYLDEKSPTPSVIVLALEDITDVMDVAEKIVEHTNQFELRVLEITQRLEINILRMQKELNELKEKMEDM